MSEFSFIDNVGWLKPFIVALHTYYKCSTVSIEKISTLYEETKESEESKESKESEESDENKDKEESEENKDKEDVTDVTMCPSPSSDTMDNSIFTNTSLSFQDANEFATHNLNSIFKNTCFNTWLEKHSWIECLDCNSIDPDKLCRISRGFGNRYVPISKKFNPLFHNTDYSDMITLAEQSYNYLRNRVKIETILKTPSSDYTRFSNDTDENIFNRFFMMNLRNFQKTDKNKGPFEHILSTYNSKVQIM